MLLMDTKLEHIFDDLKTLSPGGEASGTRWAASSECQWSGVMGSSALEMARVPLPGPMSPNARWQRRGDWCPGWGDGQGVAVRGCVNRG